MIRLATPEDAAGIVRLFRRSFPRELLDASIYGCRGVRNFVEKHLTAPPLLSDTTYLAAVASGRLAGAAEFRRINDSLFLNYIAVTAAARRQGLGRALLAEGLARFATATIASVQVDALETNPLALSWYARMGFCEVGHTDFVILDGASDDRCDFTLAGYPQALATHRHFHFSEFRIHTSAGEFAAGMLGAKYFRVRGGDMRKEPKLPSILRLLDPNRRILCLLSGEEPANKLLRLVRMKIPYPEIASRLPGGRLAA